MSANTAPIFTKAAAVQWIGPCTAANNTIDLTSGTSYLVFTAGAEGALIRELRVKANPANNTAATVMRVWVNNGSAIGTAANSTLIGELTIPATTAIATGALPDFAYALGEAGYLPAGYKIYVTFGTAPGGSGSFAVAAFGGSY
jgi:hypothetical protein